MSPTCGNGKIFRAGLRLTDVSVTAKSSDMMLVIWASGCRARPKLCKSVLDIDAREDPVRTVRAHIEYRWSLNPEVGFEATKSEVNNSVTIDGIDALAAAVLVELARHSLERDHARSVEEFLRFGVGVVVVVVEVRTFAEVWVRTAIGSK